MTRARLAAWGALAIVLAGGLALRLWGYREGLPFVYNIDEADHFVPRAVTMFSEGTLNPHYFANPPAFTYLLHFLFAIAYGGGSGVVSHFRHDPAAVYELARIAAAVLGTLALWLLYLVGARDCSARGRAAGRGDRGGRLPAQLLRAPGAQRRPHARAADRFAAGNGGRAAQRTAARLPAGGRRASGWPARASTPRASWSCPCWRPPRCGCAGRRRTRWKRVLAGALAAAVAALALFLVANPYSVLDLHAFHAELVHQSSASAESQGKLGAPHETGARSTTCGPSPGGSAGCRPWRRSPALVLVWRREAALGWVLVPAPLLFLAFMGLQGRYFGRWLLPIFPIACLLAAVSVAMLVGALGRRSRAVRWVAAAVLCAGVLAQGLLYSVHSGQVMARADTRNLTRLWMLANIPRNSRIVVEPVALDAWAHELKGSETGSRRWNKYPSLVSRIDARGALSKRTHAIGIESYETTLAPSLIGYYVANHYCWVVSGSTQSGRAFADPRGVPHAIAYYRALARHGEVVFRASPYGTGARPVKFDFDWSFDYYPLAYHRPGPVMTVYRLHGGRCGAGPRPAHT